MFCDCYPYCVIRISHCGCCRPGRPPKRATMVGISPNGATGHGMLLKKPRMDGEYPGYENGHIGGEYMFFYTFENFHICVFCFSLNCCLSRSFQAESQ